MIWTLLTAAGAAFLAAGIAQYARLLTAKKLPKWIVPAAAGLGILGYQIYMEYSWFERTQKLLPEGSVVTEVRETPAFWRPWTFAVPLKMGFSVIEPDKVQLAFQDGNRIARFRLYNFEQAFVDHVNQTAYLLNCSTAQLVPVSEEGTPQAAKALQLPRESTLYTLVCN
ncbi:MAG: hypothetical protein GX665_00050 [Gammaproteobacteria bacterium]|nr:hypothetical protein [Gammaproteobacteria bacterium]